MFFVTEKHNTFYQYDCLGISLTYRKKNTLSNNLKFMQNSRRDLVVCGYGLTFAAATDFVWSGFWNTRLCGNVQSVKQGFTETPAVSLHGYEGFLPKKDINPWIYDGIGHCKS